MKKLQIVNMYKNNIVLKNQKNKLRQKTLISSVIFCLLIFSCCYFKVVGGSSANTWYDSVQSVYNPTSQLYNSEGEIVFTNNANMLVTSGSFDLPIVSGDISVQNNQIHIEPKGSIIVTTPCPGVVDEVGVTNDGKKYIKIKHTSKIYSVIENIETVAVEKGQIIRRGDAIATANENKIVVITVYKNKKPIENLRVEDNKIVWG